MIRKCLYIFLISVLVIGTFTTLNPTIITSTTKQNNISYTAANLFSLLINQSSKSLIAAMATRANSPTLSSTDITGPYVQGQPSIFHVKATNPTDTDYAKTWFSYTISNIKLIDIATFDIKDQDGNWVSMLPGMTEVGADVTGGFGPQPMPADFEAESEFQITFKKGGNYPITIQVINDDDSSVLASMVAEIKLAALYSDDITGPYQQGKPGIFNITATNPTDTNYTGDTAALFSYTISNINLSDIATFDMGDGINWYSLPLDQSGADVTGIIGPQEMPSGYTATSMFRITFKKGGEYPVKIQLLNQSDMSLIASMEANIKLAALYSSDITGPHQQGKSCIFNITATNPTDTNYTGNTAALFSYTIANINIDDIATFDMGDGVNWYPMPLDQNGVDVTGIIGPQEMPSGYTATSMFRIAFKKGGSHPVTIQLLNQSDISVIASMETNINVRYGINLPLIRR